MLVLAVSAATGQSATKPPARLQVIAKEFSFTLSRGTIRSGRLYIELANFGEDRHDLRLQRLSGGTRTFGIPELAPGQRAELNLRLGAARYQLWCSVADHRTRGMNAILVVKR